MLCPYCGSEIQEGVVYCPICNAALMGTSAQGQVGGQVASGQYANQQPYGVQPGYAYPGTMPGGQAGKDEQNFKIAFIVTIVAIVIELIGPSIGAAATTSSTASTSSVTSALSLISSLASLVVLALIYRGIISIMNRLGRQDVASSVNTLFVASIVCFVVAILVPFIAVFSFSLVYIAAVIAALLACIPDILLLVALSKGKNALIRS